MKNLILRLFSDGIPDYLARHYWWAYLWRPAVWFFDHQPIINFILFGQYQRLLALTLRSIKDCPPGRLLQLACVYGKLTPCLMEARPGEPLYLADVAPVQLALCRGKLEAAQRSRLLPARMNAEAQAWLDDSFATVLIFFLLHEMPPAARARTLSESLRVLQPGGSLVITEYGALPHRHWLYRFPLSRWLLLRLEPFLGGFWHEDLTANLQQQARRLGKSVRQTAEHQCFSGFYRVAVYRLMDGG